MTLEAVVAKNRLDVPTKRDLFPLNPRSEEECKNSARKNRDAPAARRMAFEHCVTQFLHASIMSRRGRLFSPESASSMKRSKLVHIAENHGVSVAEMLCRFTCDRKLPECVALAKMGSSSKATRNREQT